MSNWGDRLAWSGETPLDFAGLNPVAALRFDDTDLSAGTWADAIDPAHTWTATPWAGSSNAVFAGPWGTRLGLNTVDPATEQGVLTLPFFDGLWPSSGRLLMGLWVKQSYTMTFNPLMSSRSGTPVAYLSTYTTGRLRHNVYAADGTSVNHSDYEDSPWGATTGWQWMAMLVDLDAQTSQLAAVDADTHGLFTPPARALDGAPNPGCTSPLEVFALPGAGYWSGGAADEIFVAHPDAGFDLAAYARRVWEGTWANAATEAAAGSLTVTDEGVTADAAYTLTTGAEDVSWDSAPDPSWQGATGHWSTDDGATWQTGQLPVSLDGLLRWDVPLNPGDTFTGLELLSPAPTLGPIPDRAAEQQQTLTVQLAATWSGTASWTVAAAGVVATVDGTTLTIQTGWAAGDIVVTVTLRDELDRAVSQAFTLTVEPAPWTPPPPPQFPRAPIILRGDDGQDEVIINALSAVVAEEVNGEHTLEFSIPVKHRHAAAVRSEAAVEAADESFRVRRITTERKGRAPVLTVYCEAGFYDLAYAGQIDGRDYLQTPAGAAMEDALAGTGWSIGAVTVTTRRTYSVEDTNPLAMLRTIQKQHGGDLLFDNANKTVSLVARSGRDAGVAFFYGRDLTESKKVVDTTSLVTRIYARNADGATIASVNDGKPYVEDFTWTDEVREATYDFASGTSPWTMLAMAQATLAARCKPSYSYEFTVADLSYRSGQELDRFDNGDIVTVVDDDLGIRESQRIVRVEHDLVRPWASKITLSAKLRETGGSSDDTAGPLSTGSGSSTFDLVPFNLLRNGRFDNALAHWAASGATVVDGAGTGERAVRFEGSGTRWIEQTVHPDNRDVYSLSLRADAVEGGTVPPLTAVVTVEYEDGTTDAIPVELA